MKNKFITILFILIISLNLASAFLISDQGTSAKNSSGDLLESANLTIQIYDAATGGNLVFEQNISDTIINGSWNLMINPDLEYGKSYWKDYQINSEDLDFNGNERLEFQSSAGEINNASFINFSLIDSCSAGSSIRLIYENGSVVCETDDDSGGAGANLTNYALKNESETFEGNITTTNTGFFGWLGSLTSRITKLFVEEINFNSTINGTGNINTTGNISAAYLFGDGSQLSNLPSSGDNASWNESYAYTLFLNRTSENDYLSTYNSTYAANTGNASWNESYANTLYLNRTSENDYLSTYNATYAGLINNASYLSTYNATYHAYNSTGLIINWSDVISGDDNSSWNESYANNLYLNRTSENDYLSTYNATYTGCINNASYLSTYNATYDSNVGNASFNQTLTDSLYAGIEWDYNQTTATYNLYNTIWSSTYNATYAGLINNASYLSTYNTTYHAYNSTGLIINWSDVISGDNASWNESYANTLYLNRTSENDYLSTYNSSYVEKTGDTMTGNLNMNSKNITSTDCITFASGGKICSA